MITLLHIENVAVIEMADMEFEAGLNVLSGETGAGKSIIIDSINALLGERTSRDIIRAGAEEASVTAVFSHVPEVVYIRLSELDIKPSEDGNLYISRKLRQDGRSVCRINSAPVSMSALKEIGRLLVNIHGQHDGQKLLDASSHLDYLDNYAGCGKRLDEYTALYEEIQRIKKEMHALAMDEAQKTRTMETLHQQIEEITSARLKAGEEEELLSRRQIAMNAAKILEALNGAYQTLYGGDEEMGVCALLKQAAFLLDGVSGIEENLSDLCSRLREVYILAEDCAHDLGAAAEGCDVSADELNYIESRLEQIGRLKRKYGADIGEILGFLEKSSQELTKIETSEEALKILEEQYLSLRQAASAAAKELSSVRREAALRLEKEIVSQLAYLNMEKARFKVALSNSQVDGKTKLTPKGIDCAEFLIAVNPGEDLKPIVKTASGGELSRLMLALKNVLSKDENLSVLIFDEIDAGISGAAAQKVGQKLLSLSSHVQVLCVTHLAQIAACAHHHFLIEKIIEGDTTKTTVTPLDFEGRKAELARIISGSITKTSLKTAEEMLSIKKTDKGEQNGDPQNI